MNRVLALAATLLFSVGVAMAGQTNQPSKTHTMHKTMSAETQANRLKTELNLNDQQTSEVKTLFEKEEQEFHSWRQQNPQASKQELRTEHRNLARERNEGLKGILNADQYKEYQEKMQQRRAPKTHPQPQA